ncbi:uncharacterized protein LOC133889611 [Phragmites australis]|uniref:uncharacterized protein LOC133889611 n=1 Tax=Phragmites australis TaxID=29695 RepID=UPI002D795789|nr:uncharacterized protein LOC133889611 [Phragmites australis]
MKNLINVGFSYEPNIVSYAITKLPSILPHLKTLTISSTSEDASLLEIFILSIKHLDDMKHDSVFGDASHMRQISEHKHDRLKKVQINGFCSAKRMVGLTCHILENATSLESPTVDTVYNAKADANISRCSVEKASECRPIRRDRILETHKTLQVVKRYILGRVLSAVKVKCWGALQPVPCCICQITVIIQYLTMRCRVLLSQSLRRYVSSGRRGVQPPPPRNHQYSSLRGGVRQGTHEEEDVHHISYI